MSKKSFSRDAAEKAEKLEVVGNDVPESRYQKDQQIATTESALDTKGADSSFNFKDVKGKGSELKQQKVSEVITGSGNLSGMGITPGGRSVSGTGGGVLGANNSTPQAGKARSDSRTSKKLDRTATKLNYTPSEQALLEVDESKPLADAADLDQGFNGTYRNEFARSQKIAGAVPADLMFQRSVDFIFKDKLYFIEGQMVMQSGDNGANYYPSKTYNGEFDGEQSYTDVKYHLGNFLHRCFHFGLNSDGKVRYFYADVADISTTGINADDVNMASAHRLIKSNVAELDRMNMDAKAGDEKADIWTPLARAINEPTKASALMSSIEAVTGAYVFLSYSKLTTNLAFQLNRGPKDGLNEVGPAVEECVGWRAAVSDSDIYNNFALDEEFVFNKLAYRNGDPALMIAVYDSIAKYNNKADLLLQPRGWRMHAQTADNNMNPLRVPVEFANVYAATETFSTIDHEYDPLLPICVTDKANLISPINLNETCAFFNESGAKHVSYDIVYDTTNGYAYDEKLLVEHGVPGIMNWDKLYILIKNTTGEGYSASAAPTYDAVNHVVSLASHSPIGSTKGGCDIIVDYKTTGHTGYTAIATIADASTIDYDIIFRAPKVSTNKVTAVNNLTVENKNWTYKDGGTYRYVYSDLRNNYIVTVRNPLVAGLIEYLENSCGAKVYEKLKLNDVIGEDDVRPYQDDFKLPLIFSTQYMTLAQLFICAATPWIARVRENSMKDVIYYEDNVGQYPYSKLSSLKNVPFKNYVNFDYTNYDEPLVTKVMNPVQAINWTMPEFFWKVADYTYVCPWYFNENDLNSDGSIKIDGANMSMPSIRSGVRLGLLDNFYGMTEKDIRLSLDRLTRSLLRHNDIEAIRVYKYGRTTDGQPTIILDSTALITVGDLLSCPRELGLQMDAPLGVLTIDIDDMLGYEGIGNISDLKSMYVDGTATSYRIKVFTNINTPQHPDILDADGVNINRAANYVQKWYELQANNATSNCDVTGLVFGMGDDSVQFSPFAYIGSGADADTGITINSYQRSLNTRIQFLPFIISPFDLNHCGDYSHDIYDFAYMFGLCGFRASDYRESVYNREKEVVNQGLLFVEDPWIIDSPIIKGASVSTGNVISKGYELK